MTPSDATARAERLVQQIKGVPEVGPASAYSLGAYQEDVAALTAALLAVQRETREACAQVVRDRVDSHLHSTDVHVFCEEFDCQDLADIAQAIREGQ